MDFKAARNARSGARRILREGLLSQRELPPAEPRIGHNGGPPLEHVPAWGTGGFKTFFHFRAARKRAFSAPHDVVMMRVKKAERLGLTYEEYTLELLERGKHLGPDDVEAIARIKAKRRT